MPPSSVRNASQCGEKPARLAILIVDDEPLIRWSLREAFLGRGHQVATAGTGAEALVAVRDFIGYNGTEIRGENLVPDLMIEARVAPGADLEVLAVRIDSGADRFVIEIPVSGSSPSAPTVWRNRRKLHLTHIQGGLRAIAPGASSTLLEASVMDHRLTVALDGVPIFDPIDYNDPAVGPGSGDSPVGLGAKGGAVTLDHLRIYRDVYYTSALAFTPRRPFGVDSPYALDGQPVRPCVGVAVTP